MQNQSVLFKKTGQVSSIILNRPQSINSLNLDMIRLIKQYLGISIEDQECRLVLMYGMGEKGFCAGGDIINLARAIRNKNFEAAMEVFGNEYELDLLIHNFKKPVVIIADGITMGGGLGLAAGADMVIATEHSVMAMPETRIGFFPDVGSTGWMFTKCPEGYPEFIGLTGYEMRGRECVRLGFADCIVPQKDIRNVVETVENAKIDGAFSKKEVTQAVKTSINKLIIDNIPENNEMDEWVSKYFHRKNNLRNLLDDLKNCSYNHLLCNDVFSHISERSPTALVLTLLLLRLNEGKSLEDVFANDLKADEYIIRHHDLFEGIRARLLDRDDNPRWNPVSIDDVDVNAIKRILN